LLLATIGLYSMSIETQWIWIFQDNFEGTNGYLDI